MTALPDWLVERAALDEVGPASRGRIDRADSRELADRIAALRADNAAELAAHPAAAAMALIEGRIALGTRQRVIEGRQQRARWFGMLSFAAAGLVIAVLVGKRGTHEAPLDDVAPTVETPDDTRAKGPARLLAFRQVGNRAQQLGHDAMVQSGDLLQLRYKPVGQNYGVIASVDGAGVVTLHYPADEGAPPQATALAHKPTTLPQAYQLDDAPNFERFFFITSDAPIDVQQSLASVRALARRSDSASAALELPDGIRQWSLRLRKPEPTPRGTP